VLNPNGKSYSFDRRGAGYGRGEGAAMVVLKRLDDAILDGDNIRGIIRNSGVNQDGKTPGITVPSRDAQLQLIRQVYSQANLSPLDTKYAEAHGTGTVAGDGKISSGSVLKDLMLKWYHRCGSLGVTASIHWG
jgi:acyl transferase domain-containing protein